MSTGTPNLDLFNLHDECPYSRDDIYNFATMSYFILPLRKFFGRLIFGLMPDFYFSRTLSALLLKHIRPIHYADHWSVLPFNGQALRLQKIVELATELRPTVVIETGTYIGSSTPYLASFASNRTYTIEIDSSSAAKANERFRAHHLNSRIELILDDSAVAMQRLLSGLDSQSEIILAYLDAHWLDAIPTKTELQALCDWGGRWIAVIDDFQVPHDPGYSYDEYENTVIGISEVPKNRNLRVWVPNISSNNETGAKRGTGYVFSPEALKAVGENVFDSLIEIQ